MAKTTGKPMKRQSKRTASRKIASDNRFREQLVKTVIALPLLELMENNSDPQPVVIDLNFNYYEGLPGAKLQACRLLADILVKRNSSPQDESLDTLLNALSPTVDRFKTRLCTQYIFATLHPSEIKELLELDDVESKTDSQKSGARKSGTTKRRGQKSAEQEAIPYAHDAPSGVEASPSPRLYLYKSIYKIWPDFPAEALLTRTLGTIKADAARISFSATGKGIVWAVIDSGIDSSHPHFERHRNLDLEAPLKHADFTRTDGGSPYLDKPTDPYGHGTHVAGIIGGEIEPMKPNAVKRANANSFVAVDRVIDKQGHDQLEPWDLEQISGVAPECKLLSLRVLDERGRGNSRASNILAALAYINELNEHGRNIRVHGVNLSVGYEFKAEWFGCGQSPLCIEVDRLVRSGVVVVTAAGNTGYGAVAPSTSGPNMAGLSLTINDPGNASLAITVGSTHRYMPHQYGVSYFSSKGPTGDGRLKPDLVAPGENVLSCAAGKMAADVNKHLARLQGIDK